MSAPMIKYRCTKGNCANTREAKSGQLSDGACYKGGEYARVVERKM